MAPSKEDREKRAFVVGSPPSSLPLTSNFGSELRVGLIVYGKETPMIGAVTSIHPILTDPALDGWRPAPGVIGGGLREECERLKRKPGT